MTPPPIHVLAVDDEPDICAITKEFLEMNGDLVVDTATSASEAIKAVSKERYEVIISDYQMPTEDGIQFLKQLRAAGNMTPFILFTGRGREEVVIEAIDNGAYAYIQKGGAPEALYTELAHKIRNAVMRRRMEQTLNTTTDDLQVAASRYEALIAASNTGAWEYVLDGGRIWCSPEYFSMLGRDIHDYEREGPLRLDRIWEPYLHPDDRETAIWTFQQYLRQPQEMYQQYFRMLHKDGSWRWIWSRGKILVNPNNGERVMVGSHIDVSERRQAEESLMESENRYRTLVELAPIAVFVNRHDKVVLANQACAQLFGAKTSEQLLGRSIYDLFLPEFHEKVKGRVHELRDHSQAVPAIEEKIIRLDGKVIDVEVSAVPFKEGGTNSIHVVLRDITERKLAEEDSRAAHMKMAMAMDLSSMAQWELDLGTGMFTFDERFYALYGTTAGREGGSLMSPEHYVQEFVHLDDAPMVQEVIASLFKSSAAPPYSEVEHRIIRRDGEVRHILVRIGTIFEGGHLVKLYGANQDITERRRTEAALRESEERFHMLTEMLPEAIYEADQQGRFTYINRQGMESFGLAQEDLDKGLYVMDLVMPVDIPRALINIKNAMQGDIAGQNEYQVRRKDGTSFPALISSAVVVRQGKQEGMRGIVVDISENKRVERALQEANRKLNLLSSITRHDINNQVLGLEGNLMLLEKRHPEIAQDDFLSKAERSARRISAIIQFTKSYEDIGVKAPVWQEVCGLVAAGAKDIHLENMQLVTDVPAGLEIFTDPLIVKVFHNLIDNSLRHAEGATYVRFYIADLNGSRAIICEDDGLGIGPEMREHLFVRGFGKNHGLGLFLCKEILSITGISITEEGRPGTGARFVMRVPEGSLRSTRL